MPLSAREQRILAEIEDQLTEHDADFSGSFSSNLVHNDVRRTARPATRDDRPPDARWTALPIGLTVWAVLVVLLQSAGAGFGDAALVAVAAVVLIGVNVVRLLARRALIRRFASDGHDADRRRPPPEG